MPLPVCEICGKKMPPHILEKHIAKRHGSRNTTFTTIEEITPVAATEVKKPGFDYQEVHFCQSCKTDIPEILREFHMHVRHGL